MSRRQKSDSSRRQRNHRPDRAQRIAYVFGAMLDGATTTFFLTVAAFMVALSSGWSLWIPAAVPVAVFAVYGLLGYTLGDRFVDPPSKHQEPFDGDVADIDLLNQDDWND